MNEVLGFEMPEVEGRQVERIDNKHQLADPEMGIHPQKDESRGKEIVYDEVRTNVCSNVD